MVRFLVAVSLHLSVRTLESGRLIASVFGLVLLLTCTPTVLVSIGFYLISILPDEESD